MQSGVKWSTINLWDKIRGARKKLIIGSVKDGQKHTELKEATESERPAVF